MIKTDKTTALKLDNMLLQMESELGYTDIYVPEAKKNEITHCIKCGKEITDYEDTEFLQQEGIMKFTYKCDCGFYGEQIFDVTYNRTEEI